jgi:hypothetical protein
MQPTYPRSPKALLGGIAHLGRFIDKIRLRNEGKIQEYNYITVGFDKVPGRFSEDRAEGVRTAGVDRRDG